MMGWISLTPGFLVPITSPEGTFLPLIDARGNLVEDAARIVHAFMFFPNDPVTAWAYVEVMKMIADADTLDFAKKEPRVATDISRAFREALQQTKVAGLIGQTLLSASMEGEPLSLRKAIYIVQRRIDEDNRFGKRFPRDEKNLREAFTRFKSSIHFFMAMLVLEKEEWNNINNDLSVFRRFLTATIKIQTLFRDRVQLLDWRPWLVDPRLLEPGHTITIRELNEAARKYAQDYKANPDRI
jgi:hypothetical protein